MGRAFHSNSRDDPITESQDVAVPSSVPTSRKRKNHKDDDTPPREAKPSKRQKSSLRRLNPWERTLMRAEGVVS